LLNYPPLSVNSREPLTFLEHHTTLLHLTKSLQHTTNSLHLCHPSELGHHAHQLTQLLTALIAASKGDPQSQPIKAAAQELGKESIDLINLAGRLQNSPADNTLRADLHEQFEIVNMRLLNMLHSLQQNAKGEMFTNKRFFMFLFDKLYYWVSGFSTTLYRVNTHYNY
jgi:hypothetical protein